MVERRTKEARFPKVKTLEEFSIFRAATLACCTDTQVSGRRLHRPHRANDFHGRNRYGKDASLNGPGRGRMPADDACGLRQRRRW